MAAAGSLLSLSTQHKPTLLEETPNALHLPCTDCLCRSLSCSHLRGGVVVDATLAASKLRAYIMSDPKRREIIEHEEWLEVERNADAVRLLCLQFKLGIGPFKRGR